MKTLELNILVAVDEHYIVLLAALIRSIESNLSTDKKINIYIIEDNVSAKSKKKLQQSADTTITNLIWMPMQSAIPEGMNLPIDRTSFPLNVYMRLFIPYIVAPDLERVLFLDVDMIVQKDISELFEIDLNNNVIGAVIDPRIMTFDNSWGGVMNYKELGIAGNTKYFNAGIFIMDVKKWKEQNITQKVVACINENVKFANYPDQYGMNIVLANQWLELNPLWNHFSTIDTNEIPFLIHFVERKPIYQSYSYSEAFKKIFYQYLNQTQWKNFKPIGESKRYLKKLKNILNKIFRKG